MPTRTEQADLHCATHAGHGEFPRIIVASGDVQEAFDDAAHAFNYAEHYQIVVIDLLDIEAGVGRTGDADCGEAPALRRVIRSPDGRQLGVK